MHGSSGLSVIEQDVDFPLSRASVEGPHLLPRNAKVIAENFQSECLFVAIYTSDHRPIQSCLSIPRPEASFARWHTPVCMGVCTHDACLIMMSESDHGDGEAVRSRVVGLTLSQTSMRNLDLGLSWQMMKAGGATRLLGSKRAVISTGDWARELETWVFILRPRPTTRPESPLAEALPWQSLPASDPCVQRNPLLTAPSSLKFHIRLAQYGTGSN